MKNDIMEKLGHSTGAEKLAEYVESSDNRGLFHFDAYALADRWEIDRAEVIDSLLRGVQGGIFDLEWEYHCPHCGGVAKESLSIHDAHEEDYCNVCRVNFTNTLDDNVEVLFSIHPGVRNLPESFKEEYMKTIMDAIMTSKMYSWRKPTTILGIDIINRPLFRELFEGETLMPDQSLRISRAAIFFTDIKDSTKMYERLGDSRAFRLVREHFRILFEVIEKNRGVAIKTIGDAVMGVFQDERNALAAAFESQERLIPYYEAKPEEERIEVKIGVHAGPTIVVTLNGRLDYFGTTVNMAARIQGLAHPNEVVFPETTFENEGNKKVIGAHTNRLVKSQAQLKGLSGEFVIYRAGMK